MWETETAAERYALHTLAWMCEQYLSDDGALDHMCMSAGESAVELLFRYGYVDSRGCGAQWTEKVYQFLVERTSGFD